MRILRELLVAFGLAGVLLASCGESAEPDEDHCDEGTEGCPCYGNGTCNGALACTKINDRKVCVDLAGGGGQPGDGCPSDREECSGSCVDLDADEQNCGSCGDACRAGEQCSAGACECIEGREACGSSCVDTTSDPEHCGTCATVCTTEQVCSESTCSDDCATSLTRCGRSCVDTETSSEHCGDCDVPCGADHACEGGECVCPGGLTNCDGSCVDTDGDSSHCGGCDGACGAREECVSGECECAAGSVRCGSACVAGDTCGTGGTGSGGVSGSGGSSGAGTGGRGGVGGGGASTGGAGGAGNAGGSGGGFPGGPPVVELLIDNSSSMYEPREELWDALYSALMDSADGAVRAYQDRIRFGFASFRGPDNLSVAESDPSCAQIETVGSVNPATVAPAFDNATAIDTVFRALGEQGRNAMSGVDGGLVSWETPTGHSLRRVADTVAAFTATPAGRKYIVLLTDGNPNTCKVGDPQCGQDLSVKAAQDARALGITTLILGLGDVLTANTGCVPTSYPCGERHLQDMANAGTGKPVETPPLDYWYSPCTLTTSGMGIPAAAYVPAGGGGNAEYYTGTGRTALRAELMAMFDHIVAGSVP